MRSGKGGSGSTRTPPEPGTGTVWISPVEDYWYAIWEYSKDAGPHSYRALAGPEDMTREQAIAWARQRPAERIFIHEGQDWAPL